MTEIRPNKFGLSPSTTAKITIPGLANLTSIMALCASEKTSLSGAYAITSPR